VVGDVAAPAVVIEEGGVLDGRCRMGRRNKPSDRPTA
jgi:cytoskeletal protein CcmA (bactofilin family)